jgi:hypothetical protein
MTVNPNSSFSFAEPHGLTNGSRVRVSSTGSLPAPLAPNTTYYAIVLSGTQIKFASSYADAISSTPAAIPLTNIGSGLITITEYPITISDPINVLINKEVDVSTSLSRRPLSNLGNAATLDSSRAAKAPVIVQFTNTGLSAVTHKHMLVALGATPNYRDTTGISGYYLLTHAQEQTTQPSQTRQVELLLGVRLATS